MKALDNESLAIDNSQFAGAFIKHKHITLVWYYCWFLFFQYVKYYELK